MVIAVPLEYEFADKFKISSHFAGSDAFALIEDGKLTKIIPNPAKGFKLSVSGCRRQKYAIELAEQLKTHSVEVIAIRKMGRYMKEFMQSQGFRIVQIDDLLENSLKGSL